MRLSIILLTTLWAFSANASIEAVENYLSELKTMTANFKQQSPDGTISTGKFQLKRPSKMRWAYNPPTPVLMVTRGKYLTYYDYELNQVSDVPMDDTLLSVITQQGIKFDDSNLTVAEHFEENGFITVTIEQKDAPDQGSLGMVFDASPMQLKHLIVTDATQGVTQIALTDINEGIQLEDKLFEFKDPRVGGKNKKYNRFGSE